MEGCDVTLFCHKKAQDSLEIEWTWPNYDKYRFCLPPNGNLHIIDVGIDDNGWYSCHYKGQIVDNTSADHVPVDFIQRYNFNVYKVPIFYTNISWRYRLFHCNSFTETSYRQWLMELLKHVDADVKHLKVQCSLLKEKLWELQVEVYIGLLLSISRSYQIYLEYGDICSHYTLIKNIFLSLQEIKTLNSTTLEFNSETFSSDLSSFCPSGYYMQFNVCLPCPPGSYSLFPSGECYLCNVGFYNDRRGSDKCFRCPKGTTTTEDGAKNVNECDETLWMKCFWYIAAILPGIIGWTFVVVCFLYKRRRANNKNEVKNRTKDPKGTKIPMEPSYIKMEEPNYIDSKLNLGYSSIIRKPIMKESTIIESGQTGRNSYDVIPIGTLVTNNQPSTESHYYVEFPVENRDNENEIYQEIGNGQKINSGDLKIPDEVGNIVPPIPNVMLNRRPSYETSNYARARRSNVNRNKQKLVNPINVDVLND
ncbi:hypothetical protein CHUAL_006891 [Chamberlinius hualienensis]